MTKSQKKAAGSKRAAPAPQGLPKTATASELSALLADPPFSDRWLRQLADQGFLVKAGRAEYELAASVRGYIRFVRETEVKGEQDAATSREAFESERARKLKLENDNREALLMDTSDGLAAIDHIFGEVRTGLAGIAAKATDDVAMRRRIDDAIDTILADMAKRFDQAGAALRSGRDPLASDGEVDA